MNYSPTDCFETFPFPVALAQQGSSALQAAGSGEAAGELSGELDAIGERYHEHRRQVMVARGEGLTKSYNRFHDPGEASAEIAELRRLHVAMDEAVARAYGWGDLELGHGFHTTKQGLRYTVSEAARRELLDRLLGLNHERHAEEQRQGLGGKAGSKGKRAAKAGAAPVAATLREQRELFE